MARPKQYETQAEKQAAYRERIQTNRLEVDRKAHERLIARLNALEQAVNDAATRGDAFAVEVRAASTDTLLDKLTNAFAKR